MTTKCLEPWLRVRERYSHHRRKKKCVAEDTPFILLEFFKHDLMHRNEIDTRLLKETRQVRPSLHLLLTMTVSIHTTGLSSHNLFNSVTISSQGSDHQFRFHVSFFIQVISSHRTRRYAPHLASQPVKTHAFCRDWQRSQPHIVPRAVSEFGLPKGSSLNSSRLALIPTHFHSFICSNTWFLLCLSKPRGRRIGGKQLFYLYYTRNHFLHLVSSSFPLNSNLGLNVKGERHLLEMQYITDNQPIRFHSYSFYCFVLFSLLKYFREYY